MIATTASSSVDTSLTTHISLTSNLLSFESLTPSNLVHTTLPCAESIAKILPVEVAKTASFWKPN
jgi:hypothetical protein